MTQSDCDSFGQIILFTKDERLSRSYIPIPSPHIYLKASVENA